MPKRDQKLTTVIKLRDTENLVSELSRFDSLYVSCTEQSLDTNQSSSCVANTPHKFSSFLFKVQCFYRDANDLAPDDQHYI